MEVNQITGSIVDAAMKVHTALGPGLLESVYEKCLKHELLDLLVDGQVVVELKVVEQILDIHKAQLLSYLKLADKQVGLLINFNVVHLRDGVRRLVNHYQSPASPASSAVLV